MKDMEPWVVGEVLWAREGAFVGTEIRNSSVSDEPLKLSSHLVRGELGVRKLLGFWVLSSGQTRICLYKVCVWENQRLSEAEEAGQCLQ